MTIQKVLNSLFSDLTPRQREVIVARFGLEGRGEAQTLAALGNRYGVTRERVRQIEAGALGVLRKKAKNTPAVGGILGARQKFLRGGGGAAEEGELLSHHKPLVEGLTANHLALFLEMTKAFYPYLADESFISFYYLDKESLKRVSDFVGQFVKSARAKKKEILAGGFPGHLASVIKQKRVDPKIADRYLSISKKIRKNPYGDVGLAEWPEIDPRTIRDRIYLVLKKNGKPVHFEDIAGLINETKFSGRKALAPTVHNELIKDARFVLVGRGIYGLAEQGYEPGTAREVIHGILKRQGPMSFENVVLAVQKDRFFKPNTILANLQNKDFFDRMEGGAYRARGR